MLAGYLFPIRWTGFPGNTLWSWFELIVLPAALISMRAWPAAGRAQSRTSPAVSQPRVRSVR